MHQQIARELEARRRELGWTHARLAAHAGYAENTIARVLRAENVRLVVFADVAAALGYRLALVFDD